MAQIPFSARDLSSYFREEKDKKLHEVPPKKKTGRADRDKFLFIFIY